MPSSNQNETMIDDNIETDLKKISNKNKRKANTEQDRNKESNLLNVIKTDAKLHKPVNNNTMNDKSNNDSN